MQFYQALLALLVVSVGTALPTDVEHTLDRRAVMTAVRCAGGDTSQDFTKNQVKGAVKNAKSNLSSIGTITSTIELNGAFYPHNYGGNDVGVSVPSECSGRIMVEYPLGAGNELDRVVLAHIPDQSSWIYCFSMTHRGLNFNQFKTCPEI